MDFIEKVSGFKEVVVGAGDLKSGGQSPNIGVATGLTTTGVNHRKIWVLQGGR